MLMMAKKYMEMRKNIYAWFTYCTKVFDRVRREQLIECLEENSLDDKEESQ